MSGGVPVRPERFRTQAKLLATTRQDGHVASALDTGNTFTYIVGVGWAQMVPVNAIEGQPLVGSTTELLPDPGPIRHRTLVEPDTHNRLVPVDGSPGQLPQIDEFGETILEYRYVPGGVTYPIDFASGSLTTCLDRVIPAGALGPTGFCRYTAQIAVITNASRTITWTPTAGIMPNALATVALSSSANIWGIEYTVLMTNTSSETANALSSKITWANFISPGSASTSEDFQIQVGQTSTLDTTIDWQLSAQIQASGAVTGQALVYGVAVEYGYGA